MISTSFSRSRSRSRSQVLSSSSSASSTTTGVSKAAATIAATSVVLVASGGAVGVEAFQPTIQQHASCHPQAALHQRCQQKNKHSPQQQQLIRSHHGSMTKSIQTLFYAMPDIATMKAMEMKQELESYGISTKSLFDKRDFEQALLEARNDYETTLHDVMSTQGTTKTKTKSSNTNKQSTAGSGANGGGSTNPNHNNNAYVNSHQRSSWSTDDPFSATYRSSASATGGRSRAGPNNPYNHHNHRSYHHDYKSGSMWDHASPIEEDPLNQYDNYDFHNDHNFNQHFQYHPNDPAAKKQQQKRDRERANDWTYQRSSEDDDTSAGTAPRAQYADAATQTKYKQALVDAKKLSVEEMQIALNERGISTKMCMVLSDFRHEYAKAIAENKPKKDIQSNQPSTKIDDDDDYDPSYRDVVMERYDPAKVF